jgi:uncharacterized protein with NRDE domain
MCLIALSWNKHPKYKLIVAANRDEFYNRTAQSAHFWKANPDVLAGIDLISGGTWMGVTKTGKWAAITNFRDLKSLKETAPSRGKLTTNFLFSQDNPSSYMKKIKSTSNQYNGFNLLIGDMNELFYFSNQIRDEIEVGRGVYGLSNYLLDTPWPKVEKAKMSLEEELNNSEIDYRRLFEILNNVDMYPDEQLPNTGIGIENERALSAVFIKMNGYGTRSSSVYMLTYDHEVLFAERLYTEGHTVGQDSVFQFKVNA